MIPNFSLSVLLLVLFSSTCLYAQNQVRTESKTVRGPRLDTNRVVYDENGKALRYHQYNRLMNSGEYAIRLSGDPSNPDTKQYLKRLSPREQMEAADRIMSRLAAKSPLLKTGMKLNMLPFFEVIDRTELDQKVKVLIFWSPECPPCTESFESVNEIFRQIYNPQEVITLAVTMRSQEQASTKLQEKPLLYAKLISSASGIFTAYNLNTMPTFVIADKNDVIQFAVSGIGPQVMVAFKSHLRALLNQ